MNAFVDSLLSPELRARSTSTTTTTCGRAELPLSFAPAAENTMFRSSLGVIPPHHHHHASAFQYQQQQQQQYALYHQQHPALQARFSAAPEDDEVFRHLWYEPEPEDLRLSGGPSEIKTQEEFADTSAVDHPPSSTNSLLFEPLDLPPKSTGSTGSFSLEQTLKDAFLNFNPESAAAPSPPASASLLDKMQLHQALSYGRSNGRSGGHHALYDPHATPRGPYEQDQPHAVMPLRHQEFHQHHQQASPAGNASVMNAILGIQNAPWMSTLHDTSGSNNMGGLSGYAQPSSMRQLLLSATQPSMASAMASALDQSNPLWISASMLMTPTSQLPVPELGRKISNKKSKARRPAKAPGRRTPVASALALSLAGMSTTTSSVHDYDSHHHRGSLSSPAASVQSDSETFSNTESSEKGAKGKKCVEPGCVRRAQSNSRCKAHGGGARCQWTEDGGCARSSQGGGFCRAHGGGKRCEFPGCIRGQQRKGRCYVHGGIRKCQMGECEKKDRGNGFCISHGGGKRCEHPDCSRAVRRGLLCQLHEIAG